MKKRLIAVLALAAVVALGALLSGCGGGADKYHVYELDNRAQGYIEWDIVYYSNEKEPALTAYIDESHYYKD